MEFVDRLEEMARLDGLAARAGGGLAVVWGRRRVGKTRLLVEWVHRHRGLYTVADQSAPEVQRRYLAESIATRIPGFAEVAYRDWGSLFARLAREARAQSWRGPIVFDELPYLMLSSPELPSLLQRWIDHDAAAARLCVALAGSSQRMMQGLVLERAAPLFGRATEMFEVRPLPPGFMRQALHCRSAVDLVEHFTAWGGVPRYWELAAAVPGSVLSRVDRLVLDSLGPLHREPDQLLLEELPTAAEARPVLDAIGAGSHRLSEIAARLGRPATSLFRPIDRLVGMGLVCRETPFGEPARSGKRSLYKLADPFVRMWFRVVAPQRSLLAGAAARARRALVASAWPALCATTWEDLCREGLPRATLRGPLGKAGPWRPGQRWWQGTAPEWDVVAQSVDGRRLLLGEAKWRSRPVSGTALARLQAEVATRPPPILPDAYARHEVVRAIFVPTIAGRRRPVSAAAGVLVVTASDLI